MAPSHGSEGIVVETNWWGKNPTKESLLIALMNYFVFTSPTIQR